MDTEQALLQAILAEPKEDTPRLVYADWLDENAGTVECPKCKGRTTSGFTGASGKQYISWCDHCSGSGRVPDGRAARAEFIRVQVELATYFRLVNGVKHYHDVDSTEANAVRMKRVVELERRERDLLDAHEFAWAKPVCDYGWQANSTWVPDCEWEFRRGFVSSISCLWTSWCQHSDEILKQQPIEKVRLTSGPPSLTTVENLPNRFVTIYMEERGRRASITVSRVELAAAGPELFWQVFDRRVRQLILEFCKLEWKDIEFGLPQTDVVADTTTRYDEAIRRIDQLGGLPRVRPGRPVRR